MTDTELNDELFPIQITDEAGEPVYIGKRPLQLTKTKKWNMYEFTLGEGGELPDDLKGTFTTVDFSISAARSYMNKAKAGETKSKTPVGNKPQTKREARREGYETPATE